LKMKTWRVTYKLRSGKESSRKVKTQTREIAEAKVARRQQK